MSLSKPLSTYNFFNTSPDGIYFICKLCNGKIKKRSNGGRWNMSTHMQLMHPGESIKNPDIMINQPTLNVSEFSGVTQCNIASKTPNEIIFDSEEIKLIHPFSLIISGPTSSGKSTLLFKLLENLHQNTKPVIEKVVFIYGVYQEAFKKYPKIFFTDDLDYMDVKTDVPTVIVLDDVMSSINNSKKLEELFTRGVHHRKVSVVLTLQNLFYHGNVMKTLRDNAMYIALTRHIQDVSKLDTFARQLEQKNSNYFKDSYQDATDKKYGYLFCDLHPHSNLREDPLKIKYRSLIHKAQGQVLYQPKGKGMLKADIQSSIPDSSGKLKALIQSGKTIPDSFNFSSQPPKRELLHPSFFKEPQMYDNVSMETFDDDETGRSVYSEYESNIEESEEVMPRNTGIKKLKYDDHVEKLKLFSSKIMGRVDNNSDSEVKKTRDLYQIGVMRLSDIRSLAEKTANVQYNMLKHSPLQFIRDLHKIVKYIMYTNNLMIPREYKIFLKRHKRFLKKFVNEKSCNKKKKALLEMGASGFLGLLIQTVTSTASDVLPTLLVPSPKLAEMGDYPSNSVHDSSDDDSDSDVKDSSEDESDNESSENEGSEEEDEECGEEEEDVEEVEDVEEEEMEEDGEEDAYDDTTDEEEENAKVMGFNDYPSSSGSFPIHSMTESSRILFQKKLEWFRWIKNQPLEDQYKTVVHCNYNFIFDLDKIIKHVTYSKNVSFSPEIKTFLKQHKGFIYNFIEHHSFKMKRDLLLEQLVQRIDLKSLLNCLLLTVLKKKGDHVEGSGEKVEQVGEKVEQVDPDRPTDPNAALLWDYYMYGIVGSSLTLYI